MSTTNRLNGDNGTNTNTNTVNVDRFDFDNPVWKAHRRKILASPLHKRVRRLMEAVAKLRAEMENVADLLDDCEPGMHPLAAWHDDEEPCWASNDLRAVSRIMEMSLGAIDSSL